MIKEITLELQEINESTLKNINFRILQSKYFKLFTKEQIAQIVSYPVIQDAILNLDDKELECLGIVVNDYIEREKKLYKVFFLLTYRKEHLMKENQFIFQIIRICLCHKKS